MSSPDFAALSGSEQRAVAERLLRIKESGWKPFWCPDTMCDGDPHWATDENDCNTFMPVDSTEGPNGEPLGEVYVEDGVEVGRPVLVPNWAHNHARRDQRLPLWRKQWVLLALSGRGSGKTRLGVEFVTLCARKGLDGAIVGRRGTELENTHVRALIDHAHPEFVPQYFASKDILVWPNGATTFLFSAERPENIRSVNLQWAWVDEASHMDEIETAWMNLKMATRIETPNNPIQILVTSTPTPTKWTMMMEDDPEVEVRRVSTYANRKNLSKDFLLNLEREYEGTRMGRQEIHGEVLRDVEGALWTEDMFQHLHLPAADLDDFIESLDDRVLAVDPAGSKGARSDATGIIAAGAMHFDDDGNRLKRSHIYVLGDATLKGSPTEWAAQVFKAARFFRVTRIIVEKNFGGDMVKQTLEDWAALNPGDSCDENLEDFKIELVHAVKSKETRAEPLVNRYEQGAVTHVVSMTMFGDLSRLEKEQTMWVPKSRGGRSPSPNSVDALVWCSRALDTRIKFPGAMATPQGMKQKLTSGGQRWNGPLGRSA